MLRVLDEHNLPHAEHNFSLKAAAAGLQIIDFTCENTILWISDGATVTLKRSTIAYNAVYPRPNATVISVHAVDPKRIGGVAQQQDTILRMDRCFILSNTPPSVVMESSGSYEVSKFDVGIYSNTQLFVNYFNDSKLDREASPLSDAPTSRHGISNLSPWFLDQQQV